MATGRYHWSQCAYPAKFFAINANASTPWLILALHPSYSFLTVAATLTVFFIYIEFFKKMTFVSYMRSLRSAISGRIKSVKN